MCELAVSWVGIRSPWLDDGRKIILAADCFGHDEVAQIIRGVS